MRRPAWLDVRRGRRPGPSAPPAVGVRAGADDLLASAGRPLLGLPPVRPPVVPQHRGGARRRCRRAAPLGPGRTTARRCPARGLALSTDGNPRWCALDPRAGTRLVVAESALNVACAGARPVALVNCLNFGNPEHPEVMWQLSEAIDGMAEACTRSGHPRGGRQREPLQREQRYRYRPDPRRRDARARRPPAARRTHTGPGTRQPGGAPRPDRARRCLAGG